MSDIDKKEIDGPNNHGDIKGITIQEVGASVSKNSIGLEAMIRKYSLENNESALSYDLLKKITYDYLNKVIRGNNLPRWDKGVKEELNELGYMQNRETGQPQRDGDILKAWEPSMAHTRLELEDTRKELSDAYDLIEALRIDLKYPNSNTYDGKDLFNGDIEKNIDVICKAEKMCVESLERMGINIDDEVD
jgi:hypothetical protein